MDLANNLPTAPVSTIQNTAKKIMGALEPLELASPQELPRATEQVIRDVVKIIHPKKKKLHGVKDLPLGEDPRVIHAVRATLKALLSVTPRDHTGLLHIAKRMAGNLEALRAGAEVTFMPSVPDRDNWFLVRIVDAAWKRMHRRAGVEITFNVITGYATTLDVTQWMSVRYLRMFVKHLGLISTFDADSQVHHRDLIGMYVFVRISSEGEDISVTEFSGKQSLMQKNKALYHTRYTYRQCPLNKPYPCIVCNETFSTCGLAARREPGYRIVCPECGGKNPSFPDHQDMCAICAFDAWFRVNSHVVPKPKEE